MYISNFSIANNEQYIGQAVDISPSLRPGKMVRGVRSYRVNLKLNDCSIDSGAFIKIYADDLK